MMTKDRLYFTIAIPVVTIPFKLCLVSEIRTVVNKRIQDEMLLLMMLKGRHIIIKENPFLTKLLPYNFKNL